MKTEQIISTITRPDTPTPKSITIRDIAKVCGVGKTTVGAAIYGTGRISEQKRADILRVAEEMGYDPALQTVARRLGLQKSQQRILNHVLAYFTELDFTFGAYAREPYRGIAAVCHRERFAVLLTENDDSIRPADILAGLPGTFARGDADGAIMAGHQGHLLDVLRRIPGFGDRPVVRLFHPSPDASCVLSDDQTGTADATRHLLALGHRHFLHLYMPIESAIVINRVNGIQEALTEAGLDPAAQLSGLDLPPLLLTPQTAPHVLPRQGAPAQEVTLGADILLPYLHAHPEITAIFCENDAMALHLWHMLLNAGLHVPGDISLIGFDDTDGMVDGTGVNHLTTIRLPLYDMGVAAADLLIQRITGQLTEDEHRVLPVEFIVRQSTAPPRSR